MEGNLGVTSAARPIALYGIVQDEGYFASEVAPLLDHRTVRFHGAVGGDKRLAALGRARALLHLVNFDEPFGLSVVEAMACGTPVIASRRGSMPEIIEDGVNGFLVDTADEALAAVERVGDLDRREVRRSIQRRFHVDRMADDYIALYRSILAAA